MALNIAVCIKPVPDPDHYDKVTIDPQTKRITRTGIPTIINPVDKNAIEQAIRLKEKFGGKVTVITMAPPNATENLKEALAMGADEGYLLSDRAFGGADTLSTSYTLAKGLKKICDFDLVFTGAESADGATAQVSAQLGEWMEMPHLWNVFEMTASDEKSYKIKTKFENGYMEWEAKTPLVVGVSREICPARFVSAIGIIKAKNKPITVWGRADFDNMDDKYLGLPGSPTKAGTVISPDLKRAAKKLTGDTEEIVAAILDKFRKNGVSI